MLRLSTPFDRSSAGSHRSFARRAVIGVATAAVSLSAIAVAPAQAADRPAPVEQGYQTQARGLGITLTAGPTLLKKYGFKDEHLGLLTVNGKPGICYDYGEKSPDGKWTAGPIADVKPGRDRDRMQWIANRYWADAQKNDTNAAAYKSAINMLRSKEFRSDWLISYAPQLKQKGPKVSALTNLMLTESRKYAGPAKVAIDFSKPAPGGKGVAVAKLTVGGKAYPGQSVKWTLSGASVLTSAKVTSKDGTAKLSFVRGAGPVSIKAVATVPEWREAGYTVPSSASKQHLIRGGFSTSVSAAGKFDSLAGVVASSKCDSLCDGRPPVTFSGKASSSPMRLQATSDGKTYTLELAAGKSGSKTIPGVDGQRVTFAYSVKVDGKWSAYRTISKPFDVVCPAWPKVTMTKACDCGGKGKATYTFTSPGGIRLYDVALNGQTKRISGTQAVTIAVPVKSGTSVSATFTAYDKAGKQLSSGVLDAWTQS